MNGFRLPILSDKCPHKGEAVIETKDGREQTAPIKTKDAPFIKM